LGGRVSVAAFVQAIANSVSFSQKVARLRVDVSAPGASFIAASGANFLLAFGVQLVQKGLVHGIKKGVNNSSKNRISKRYLLTGQQFKTGDSFLTWLCLCFSSV
jgi:hypothetical protein